MSELPTVTVIMPIRNEAAFIERSLSAVLAQDYPPERMEVVIADGMSTDNTREVIARTAAMRPEVQVTIVDNPGRIVPTGFNRALMRSTGEVIVRVDGHTIVEPNYVSECVAALGRSGADNVGGRMDAVAAGHFGRAAALATSSPFGVGGARFHYSTREELVDTVYMGAWPREVFERIGLFDEEQVRNQDDEFNYRLREHGGKILLTPRIQSHYYNRTTPRSLWRQYFQYGYWKVRVMQKHPRQMRLRHFVPSFFVATLTLALVLAPVSATWARVLRFTALSYSGATLVATLIIAIGEPLLEAVLVPAAFATLHISYGLGFLTGLVRFATRWSDHESHWTGEASLGA